MLYTSYRLLSSNYCFSSRALLSWSSSTSIVLLIIRILFSFISRRVRCFSLVYVVPSIVLYALRTPRVLNVDRGYDRDKRLEVYNREVGVEGRSVKIRTLKAP